MAVAMQRGIRAWVEQDCLFEVHRYVPVDDEQLVPHSHAEYQFGLGDDNPGEYTCRGTRHVGGAGWLSVVHPGEPHAGRLPERPAEPRAIAWRMCYVPPAALAEAAGTRSPPFVGSLMVDDPGLAELYRRFHRAAEPGRPPLVRDEVFVAFAARLAGRHAGVALRPPGRERDKVRAVCGRLLDDLGANPTLDELAAMVGLGRYQLARSFRRETGLPVHVYQTQARVDLARHLLAAGRPPSEAATEAGFYDQSHLGRHFTRLVKVTPGRYGPNAAAGD